MNRTIKQTSKQTNIRRISPSGSLSCGCRPVFLFIVLLLCVPRLSGQQVAVKTNAMYWLTATPNFSAEVSLGRHVSFQFSMGYNAWKFPDSRSLKHTLFIPEVRYWFKRPMEQHFVGIYGQTGKFNLHKIPFFDDDGPAFRGNLLGGGFSYGYQWALGRRFGIEVSIGIGYLNIPYSKYQYTDCCAERISDHRRNYFGPTKLALNLIYLIR